METVGKKKRLVVLGGGESGVGAKAAEKEVRPIKNRLKQAEKATV